MLLFLSTIAVPSISRVNLLAKPSFFTTLRRFQLPHKYSTRSVSCVHNRTSKRDGDVVVLGIETSCDDTAAAVVSIQFLKYFLCGVMDCRLMVFVVQVRSDGQILSQVVSSQVWVFYVLSLLCCFNFRITWMWT